MIPVFMFKDGDMYKQFDGVQAAFRYLKEFELPFSDNEIYEVINRGLDDHKPWHHDGHVYDFRTYKVHREERANRKTR